VPRNLSPLALDADSVVLITGGAAGITAEIARSLAKSPCVNSQLVITLR
jgi:NADP-dependent 3-hydroxy acid dehydrogenase YdfG